MVITGIPGRTRNLGVLEGRQYMILPPVLQSPTPSRMFFLWPRLLAESIRLYYCRCAARTKSQSLTHRIDEPVQNTHTIAQPNDDKFITTCILPISKYSHNELFCGKKTISSRRCVGPANKLLGGRGQRAFIPAINSEMNKWQGSLLSTLARKREQF
jgi:hypothetical protein